MVKYNLTEIGMEMTVKDVIKMLYIACDGNLDMPFLGVCLSGSEQQKTMCVPSKIDAESGKVIEGGTLFGYMKPTIHKSADYCWKNDKYIPAIAIKRGGISDIGFTDLKEKLGKTIEL